MARAQARVPDRRRCSHVLLPPLHTRVHHDTRCSRPRPPIAPARRAPPIPMTSSSILRLRNEHTPPPQRAHAGNAYSTAAAHTPPPHRAQRGHHEGRTATFAAMAAHVRPQAAPCSPTTPPPPQASSARARRRPTTPPPPHRRHQSERAGAAGLRRRTAPAPPERTPESSALGAAAALSLALGAAPSP